MIETSHVKKSCDKIDVRRSLIGSKSSWIIGSYVDIIAVQEVRVLGGHLRFRQSDSIEQIRNYNFIKLVWRGIHGPHELVRVCQNFADPDTVRSYISHFLVHEPIRFDTSIPRYEAPQASKGRSALHVLQFPTYEYEVRMSHTIWRHFETWLFMFKTKISSFFSNFRISTPLCRHYKLINSVWVTSSGVSAPLEWNKWWFSNFGFRF